MNAWAIPQAAGPARALGVDRSPVWAGVLSVLVHGGLLLALVLGVSWRNAPNQPVQAEIWTRLPEPAVIPRPEPVAEAKPKIEPLPVRKPDIALKTKIEPKQASKPPVSKVELKKSEAQRQEVQKRESNKRESNKREEARRALDQALAKEALETLEADLAQVKAQALQQRAESRVHTAAQLKAIAIRDAQERIRLKIRGLLRIPEGVKGNPEVVYRVSLFPNGEIMGAPERIQSSGQPAYDAAVEAAILKASPLPLPTGAGAAADFREGLELRFRPREG